MTKPITVHTASRSQVSIGRNAIMNRHMKMPSGATIQTSGVRNGRCTLGALTRSTITPTQTMTKADQRADGDQLAQNVERQTPGQQRRRTMPVMMRAVPGRAEARMDLG